MPLVQLPSNNIRPQSSRSEVATFSRPLAFYVVVVLIGLIFTFRLFYLQVVRGDHYRQQALAEHQKKFEIPAKRGIIYAHDGDRLVPLVLNETRKLIYADPRYVKDKSKTAQTLKDIIGGEAGEYEKLLNGNHVYVILARDVTLDQADKLAQKKLPGVGQTDTPKRVYPQGQLASQVLGFVNGSGQGQYGVEDFFNKELQGKTGQLKAVTDINGVPLAAGDSSIQQAPKDGENVNLTIDLNLQRYLETALKSATETTKAKGASAVILDTKDGSIKAMGNYPSFDPAKYSEVKDYNVFSNRIVSTPYEAGSVMKVFTMSTALNEGVVSKDSTFADSGSVKVEDRTVKNSRAWGIANPTMTQVLQYSLNTGVVHLFKQLGGGSFNKQGREKLHDYLVDKYRFNATTGIELAGEAGGDIPDATTNDGDNVRYANISFGQGMTVTMLQVVAGLNAVINGGTYYKPAIQEKNVGQTIAKNIVKPEVGADLRDMMRSVIKGSAFDKPGYYVGGKSGTAQLLDANGNYTDDKTTGSYLGFIGSKQADYVIMVRVDEPDSSQGFSGTTAAAPLFSSICGYLIQYYAMAPAS